MAIMQFCDNAIVQSFTFVLFFYSENSIDQKAMKMASFCKVCLLSQMLFVVTLCFLLEICICVLHCCLCCNYYLQAIIS